MHKSHDDLEWRVQKRTVDLASTNEMLSWEVKERRRVETALQESNRMLKALSLVQSYYISGLSLSALFRIILKDFVALTDSKIGFIGEILHTSAGDRYIKTVALTNVTMHDECRQIYEKATSNGLEFHKSHTLFGAVLMTEKAVISNDPAMDSRHGSFPEGHPHIDTFLGLPIHYGNKLVGVVGLANRLGGFNDKLVEYVSPFMITCGNIIEAERNRERREAAEHLLRESEERYRRITEELTDYLYKVRVEDGKAVETTHGPVCETVTGYTPQDYAADSALWLRMIVPDDQEEVTEHIKRTLAGEKLPPIEHRIIHKNGEIRWISDNLIPQLDAQGTLVGYDGVIKDITERKQAAERVSNSNAMLKMIIDGISDPIFMVDAEFKIKKLNKAAKNYYGLTRFTHAIGKFCFEAFRGMSSPCDGCDSPFSDMRGYSGSYERKGKIYPDRLEEVTVDVVRDSSGAPKATIFRIHDITQARMMDRQSIQNEKLASLGLLIAGVAHEINNPNNFIYFNTPILRSYLQFLLPIVDEYAASHPELRVFGRSYSGFREDCFKLLDNIEHGSTRINQIVANLREFAHERGRGERRWIDLKQVMEKSLSICLGRIKKLIKTIDVDVPEGLPALLTDPLAVEQVVINLLINAAQAADKDDSWIKLTITDHIEPDNELLVDVSDNGCGMDTNIMKKIFDPFFTTKTVGVGTGLGLSISHRLVTELGGHIEVESEVGKGSLFRVVLPAKSS
jgi:PAS domain S-box-containing protein